MSATIIRRSRAPVSQPSPITPFVQPVAISPVIMPVDASNSNTPTSSNPAYDAFVVRLSAAHVATVAANAMTREAKKAKDALNEWMVGNNVTSDSAFVDMPNGSRIKVIANIQEVSEDYMDIHKLQKLVDESTFMSIISATKTAVESIAGTNIVISATSTRMKPATLSIKEMK